MTIRVIDTESTGFDPATSHLIQIASIDLTRDGFYTNAQDAFVRLPDGVTEIPAEASAVHHIIPADLTNAEPAEVVIPRFLGVEFYVAHNAAHDMKFLPQVAESGGKWICSYKCALRVWPDAPGHSNQILRYWLGLVEPFGMSRRSISAHDALSDVYVTGAIFQQMLKAAKFADLLRWTEEPPLFPRWTFGKFRGQPVDVADVGWFNWVLGKPDLSDWHHTCRLALEKRRQAA